MDKLMSDMERDRELNVSQQNNAIREPDRLSIEEVEHYTTTSRKEVGLTRLLAKQLLDTMRENELYQRQITDYITQVTNLHAENERLRDALECYASEGDQGSGIARDALESSKTTEE